MSFFELGGIKVPLESVLDFQQNYEPISDNNPIRLANGSAILLSSPLSSKIRTTLSGKGWVIAGLNGIDFNSELTLKCAVPLGISSASNVITLPSSRRSDSGYEPYGYAIMPDGSETKTNVNISVDTATLDTVSGATQYKVEYFPELQVIVTKKPRDSVDRGAVTYSWAITAEEV